MYQHYPKACIRNAERVAHNLSQNIEEGQYEIILPLINLFF